MSRVLKTKENQITDPYGNGHSGIDLVGKTNQLDSIIAHSAGTVTYVQTGHGNNIGSTGDASYGNLVKIKHGNGMFTLYAHLNSVSVNVGENVAKGKTIGYMGNTGNSYGAHLHFEVRSTNDATINPTSYINSDLPNLPTGDVKPEPLPPTTDGLKFKVGDTVKFTGTKHYTSSQGGANSTCKGGTAKVTIIEKGAKYPYHLVHTGTGSTVYGWVAEKDVEAVSKSTMSEYTVRAGDSLWAIADKFLGDGNRYKEIKTLNNLKSDTIHTGQKLKLPAILATSTYTVKKGDTLWDIAAKYLGDGNRYKEIKTLNGITSDVIYSGQVLKLPKR